MSLDRFISSMIAFILSSNCPLYLVPATMSARSRIITFLFFNSSGISPFIIFCARPSTIAVLPTPASPSNTGLFFVRLESIWITLSISFCLPITGSNLLSRASCERFLPNASSAGVFELDFAPGARPPPPCCCCGPALKPGVAEPKSSTTSFLTLSRSTPIFKST